MTQIDRRKYNKVKKLKEERLYEFATRLVESFPYALTHEMALDRINIRSWPVVTQVKISNALDYAAKMGLIRKYRDEHYKAIVFEGLKTPHKKDAVKQFNPSNFNKKPQDAIEAAINDLNENFSKKRRITGNVRVVMNADQFVENLRRLDRKLYERVLDEIGDSIGIGGSWGRADGGHMVYEVKI